jgi:hypothetical protein
MIGETILHYPPEADQPMADKILEKLGEGGLVRRFIRRSFSEGGNLCNKLEMSNDR